MNIETKDIIGIIGNIKGIISEEKDYLIELDAQNGDGDLGLSMDSGFTETFNEIKDSEEEDLGKLFHMISRVFNEAAPSTMGTLLSIYFMGMAKNLRGITSATIGDFSSSMESGLANLMEKGEAKPGEKTILDSLFPAIERIKKGVIDKQSVEIIFTGALEKAKEGMLETKRMKSVHGRAAYYGEKSLGIQDGGATVGMYIIKGISNYISGNQ